MNYTLRRTYHYHLENNKKNQYTHISVFYIHEKEEGFIMSNEAQEILAFCLYLAVVLAVGVIFFLKSRKSMGGEKEYFLGGRKLNGWVAALSAGASDMSAWVLMGLPGSIYLYGMGQVWISIGLFIGTILAWIFVAPRLRRFSIESNDSITIPQYLTNRFKTKNRVLLVVCAIIFLVAYCIYAASSIVACGDLFNTVFGFNRSWAMVGATAIILVYTFLGGFNAVCWTDFIQGMLMLVALMAVPIIACFAMGASDFPQQLLLRMRITTISSRAANLIGRVSPTFFQVSAGVSVTLECLTSL